MVTGGESRKNILRRRTPTTKERKTGPAGFSQEKREGERSLPRC